MRRPGQLTPLLFALGVMGAAAPLQAQEMVPLEQVYRTADPAYMFTRCAGLYSALLDRSGPDAVDAATAERTEAEIGALMELAAGINREAGLPEEVAGDEARRDADLYRARFAASPGRPGKGPGDDQLVVGDLEFCRTLVHFLAVEEAN